MTPLRLLRIALAAGFCLGLPAAVKAQTVINSVPYVINVSGKYVLGGNLNTATAAQTAITINAPNVVLDLNQFYVSGPGGTPASTTPVISVAAVSNVTIRNGTIANNGYGVFFNSGANSINHILENLVITRCYITGIFFAGTTTGCLVQNNQLSQIGNSTYSANVGAYAIYTNGGARVEGNTIIGVTPTGNGTSIGIYASPGDFMFRNAISNVQTGINNGKYQGNLFYNVATPFTSGTDAGLNN